jgi:hypothetical protein
LSLSQYEKLYEEGIAILGRDESIDLLTEEEARAVAFATSRDILNLVGSIVNMVSLMGRYMGLNDEDFAAAAEAEAEDYVDPAPEDYDEDDETAA